MACIKLLVGLTIAINMGFIICEKYRDHNSPEKTVVVPIRYNIVVIIHSENLTFSAEVTTRVNVDGKIYYVVFHVPNQIITNHPFIEREDGLRYETNSIIQRDDLGIVELHFESTINSGFYRLVIKSMGFLYNDVKDFFKRSYLLIDQQNDEWFFAPVFQSIRAQTSQCWNKSALKTFFNISINHLQKYVALSNMIATPLSLHKNDGTITTLFETTPKISPYHVMIMITKLNAVFGESGDIVCRSQIVPHLKFGKNILKKVEEELESYTINSWIIPKLNLIVIPEQVPVMAKWGFIIYSEKYFIYDKNVHSVDWKIDVATVIARGLVYQWIANVANPSSCIGMRLNEALASFFQMYILDKSFPNWRIMDLFVVRYQQLALRNIIDLSMNPITDKISDRNNTVSLFKLHSKGPFLLRMLQHLISEELFRIGIIKFLHKYQYHSAIPDIFWDTMQEVLLEKKIVYAHKLNLKDMMNNWLTQEDYPLVYVTRDYCTNAVLISQSNFNRPKREKNGSWIIPITFTTQSKPNFSNTMSHFLLDPKKEIWINNINKHDWIIINLQQSGYYRVSYDYTNWQKIASYLNSDEYTKIHVLNRAQIIDDAYHLMVKNELDPIMFFQLMGYLKLETDYIAWYPMRNILPNMWSFSQFPEGLFIKQHISQIWDRLLDDARYVENPDDDDITKIRRTFAIEWACNIGHSKCREETNVMLNKLIANFTTKTILSPLEKVIYCTGMMVANITTWTKVLARYIYMQDKEVLKYLACSENETIIMFYLETIAPISNYSIHSFNKTEEDIHAHHEIVYREIIKKHSKKNLVLEYILSNFMRLKPSKISAIEALSEIIKNVQHKKQINKIKKYLQVNLISKTILLDPTATLEKADNLLKKRQNELKENLIEFKRIFKML